MTTLHSPSRLLPALPHMCPVLPCPSHLSNATTNTQCCVQGEDWEHEDVAADDDVDMGEGEADEGADMSPVRR